MEGTLDSIKASSAPIPDAYRAAVLDRMTRETAGLAWEHPRLGRER